MAKIRRFPLLCLLLVLLLTPFSAWAEGRVFLAGEADPFPKDAELLTLRVADVFGGDCMLMTWREETLMIDAGESFFFPAIQRLLSEAGSPDHVDTLFNSHPHRDHTNGFFRMLENGITVGRVLTAFPHDYDDGEPSVVQLELIAAAEAASIPIVDVKTEDTFTFGPAEITVLRVPDEKISRKMTTNDLSAMLMIRWGECSMLLSGDCERRAQTVLANTYSLKADIAKAPHHGLGSMHEAFLRAVQPKAVFITGGSSEARRTVNQMKIRRTPYFFSPWGEITIQTDGTSWLISQTFHDDIRVHAEKHWQTLLRYKRK